MVWSIAMCPDNAKQDPVAYGGCGVWNTVSGGGFAYCISMK